MSVAEPPSVTPLPLPHPGDHGPRSRPRIKKLRLIMLVGGLSALALISTVFGMMMAVASNLGDLASDARFRNAANSVLEDAHGRQIGVLVNNKNLVFVSYDDIAPAMRHAIIAIEDRRFFTNPGVDIRGIGRAFVNDVAGGDGTQGGSTITQQFVKNAENQQTNRNVFEKLREAAMAYHLTRKWSKEKILTEYLNTIYFGNGAYGVESAARIYFGSDPEHAGCGTKGKPSCASQLRPDEAALLAGMVQNPSGYDPQTRWSAAMARRNLVLEKMVEQGYITQADLDDAIQETAPPAVRPPAEQIEVADPQDPSRQLDVGYFNNWVRQQLVDRYGPERAFRSGWQVRTTLDIDLQAAAEHAVESYLPNTDGQAGVSRPTAAMVVIDNESAAVRAMVGGPDYANRPFNLATQGQRQPGSAFKPFVLAAALREGISPGDTFESRKKIFDVPGTNGKEKFVVNNYEGNYSGITDLAGATTFSDNSVYAEVGYKTGFRNIAKMARAMGIRSNVSTNPAITLGGLEEGVTVLDMAHAYETFATGGKRIEGSLGARGGGPVGIRLIRERNGDELAENEVRSKEVFTQPLADTITPILQSVVTRGTGVKAQYGGFAAGKTGTTENYGDAWFVGYTEKYTVAVWVGYPDGVKPMKTEFGGSPVAGGTFPAQIWRAFVVAAVQIDALAEAERALANGEEVPTSTAPLETNTTPLDPSATGTPTAPATDDAPEPAAPKDTAPQEDATPPAEVNPSPGGQTETPGNTGGVSPGTGGTAPPGGATDP
ncbi:MAG: transglycosylase domain-containing protein [Solirubrobacteraceae bacterium]